ncbi:MAG: TRAP transporter substrate-binding protein [Burkholderiaceae bacterium]|nr:TRAP transporter substrate-binding protein [Burkholderiaceae bacterium]
MTTFDRRSFVLGGAGVIGTGLVLPRFAHAAEYTYKFANNLPPVHPINVRATEAAARIKEDTGGRVELQIFPSSQLGSDSDMLSQLRSGGVQFFTMAGALLASFVPVAAIEAMAYAFKDYDTVWKAMDGDLGELVRTEIAKSSIVAMDRVWDNGFHQITTRNRPINTPADMKGLKIRTGATPLQMNMCTALGALPTPITFGELYTSLQTGVVDAQLNALVVIESAKLYEVQKHCAMTNHMWSGFWFLANKAAWNRLPDPLRETVARHLNAAALAERDDVAKANSKHMANLKATGMQFTEPESAPFRAVLRQAGFYADWRGKLGDRPWSTLEKYVGQLA